MSIRQEQIVFLLAVLLVAGLYMRGDDAPTVMHGGSKSKQMVEYEAPLPLTGAASAERSAALFSPPRDNRPLPPLDFEEPPLPEPLGLAPPPASGLSTSAFGRLLRTEVRRGTEYGLFDTFDIESGGDGADGSGFADVEIGDGIDPDALESQERRELEALYRRLYDIVDLEDLGVLYGRITNDEPYGLRDSDRLDEAIVFVEVAPATGEDRYPGQPSVRFERVRVRDFQLAQTVENELRQAFHDLPPEASPATWRDMVELAERCIENKYAFDGVLDLARELFERVAAFRTEEPEPLLGLVRVHEAAFNYEAAFEEAERAVEKFGFRPEPLVALARLEREFLLIERAEARLREAVGVERGTWVASAALGELLVERGRFTEAAEHLERAFGRLPADVGARRDRDRVRGSLAVALLGAGRVDDAARMFAAMLRSDVGDERAMAGLLAARGFGATVESSVELPAWAEDASLVSLGPSEMEFDLLVNRGLAAIEAGDFENALRDLRSARRTDPLREIAALRGLSWLAERAGLIGRALDLVDEALESKPGDVWSLVHRGRLLLSTEDFEGARASLRAALEQDAELGDALTLLGLLEYRREHFDEAELYFERALELAEERGDERPDLWALRAVNHVSAGAVLAARDAARTALEMVPDDAVALSVRAWCEYLAGRAEEAIILLRQMDDTLRSEPEEDPRRVWVARQIERITEHRSKQVWIDDFEYSTVGLNNWFTDEVAGPTAQLEGGVLHLSGTFTSTGEARYYRIYPAARFVAFEADVWISAETNARAGIFVARENPRGREGSRTLGRVNVARNRDGVAQVLANQSSRSEEGWIDLPESIVPFTANTWHRLRIETAGEGSEANITVYFDGLPVIDGERFNGFGRANNELKLGLFVEGDTGRLADVRMDNVEVTERLP